ncbi:phenylalanine--tRNA ligase subunit beta [Reinekea thalattae]|uniref:Phenylalanine--tRNA ligase beta subunit n=1 Tax=Reinekea thalattae TaxID=2593301 RepID=A0A5C8Z8T9_9GAMM|nr:phenylalanine--tRNA ligase subunit beta [Reinekea thalattae]TXR53688.1 phenylalanine--tRNA ligase subunit beta [Reinekea thalattae]
MKISEKWLRTWVNPAISAQELMDQVTMAGLEVDGFEPVAEAFSGVVIGEITACEQHPNADKLRVCQVTNGTDSQQVVCGAPNARAGLKVAFAEVGAVLPGDFKIKKAKLRDAESFGMLCSEKELGLSESHDGIMELAADAPVGTSLRDYLDLDDIAIDIDLTPNRADCFSVRGIAREVSVLNNESLTEVAAPAVEVSHNDTFPVEITDGVGCPRYIGRVFNDVDVTVPTPIWMVERLRRAGVRSIDPVVDITNYVMLELGQPLHGFDLDSLNEKITVRKAQKGEKLTLLDGQELELDSSELLIADASGPLALAGIMGGKDSGVSESTKRVFLECAFFAPIEIAGKARAKGLHTDASHRYERGVDFQLQEMAVERASALLIEICGAKAGPAVLTEHAETVPVCAEIELNSSVVTSMLGVEIDDARIEQILVGLGFTVLQSSAGYWKVKAPSWRFDMAIQADLVEELARIYGYNNLPITAPTAELKPQGTPEQQTPLAVLADRLVSLGYQEAVTYSFVEPSIQQQMFPNESSAQLANPISADMSVMRVSLWPGLLKALQHNLNRQQDHVRLFESGLRFRQEEKGLEQVAMISGVVTGSRLAKGWYEQGESVDFYDVKGDLEQLLNCIHGVEFDFLPGKHSALHPGQCARIERDGKLVGYLGALHPNFAKLFGIKQSVYLFELRLDRIQHAELPKFSPLSKHPSTSRDLAVVVDEDVSVSGVVDSVKEMAGDDLVSLNLFDIYRGKGIDSKRKSLAFGLTWQNPSRTLTDDEVNQFMDSIINTLQTRFDASLRG